MNVRQMLERCADRDGVAWMKLWMFVEEAGLPPIRRLLETRSLDGALAEDVLQEFYLFLLQRDLGPLQTFSGTDPMQFHAFVRTVVVHFALNVLKKLQRQHRRVQHMSRPEELASTAIQAGPTSWQISQAIRELEFAMTPEDRAKWRLIQAHWNVHETQNAATLARNSAPSDRTFRRWSLQLFRKYASDVF